MLKYCLIILFIFSGELFAQGSSIDTACLPVVTITESENNICIGTAVTFHATVTNDGTNEVYKWEKNNLNAGVNNNAAYTAADFKDGDVVTCEYSCKTVCGADTTVISNPVTMHVVNDITPVITIANNDPLICEGELTVFTSQSFYGNAVPFYQWMVNGSPVGTNSPDYSTTSLTNGSRVECRLTIATPSCPGTYKPATSEMTIYVYPLIHPAITITPSKTEICRGEEVTFTATANGGTYPTFAWEINGKPTGDVGTALITSTLKDGDSISCTVTIDQDSRCHTSTSAPSNKIGIAVKNFTDPALIIAAVVSDVCAGTPVTFTATGQNAGDYKLYQWQVNGHNKGGNSSIFIYNQFANGDKVSCTLSTNVQGCPITASVLSNDEVVTVRSAPVITFLPPEISVMSGESAHLNASVSGNTSSFLWKPPGALLTPQSLTSSTVPLSHDTILNLTVTDINGCTASKELAIKVLYKLYMPSAFTPNKDGKNDVFRIPSGASVSLHVFSVFNRWGNVVFTTTDITKGWDGTYQDQNFDTGTYVYFIKGIVQDNEVIIKGTVTLIR
jgi:gliding motility-associated-like protein